MTYCKNHNLVIDDAQTPETSTAEVQVSRSQVTEVIMVEEGEEENTENISGGSANAAPVASENVSPMEIARKISILLSNKGIPQCFFAERVLNRSQGSFSDYLSKPPAVMPKTHSRAIWLKLKQFLENEEEQKELIIELNKGKYCLMSLLRYHNQQLSEI